MPDPATRPATPADVLQIEQALRAAVPEAVFAAPRVVRRIIRADLDLPLLRARVPHRESIALPPARLLELADDVWALPATLQETVLLVARPDPESFAAAGGQDLLREYWRLLAHGCLDVAARQLLADETVDGSDFGDLVERVGEIPFAEAMVVLAQEGLLRDPGDRREAMAEFIAVTLELATFSPALLPAWFPAVADHERLVHLFNTLVDGDAILARTKPTALIGADPTERHQSEPSTIAGATLPTPGGLTRRAAAFVRRRSLAAARRGNDVRGALLQWRLRTLAGGDETARARADRGLVRRLMRLVGRLDGAVGLGGVPQDRAAVVLAALVERADGSAWSQPARFLYDLQKICVDSERESYRTRLLSWALTLGRVPLVKPLPAQRVALVHRHAAAASRRLPALGLRGPLGEDAVRLVASAMETSEAAVRTRLTPPIRESLVEAGLEPATLVEQAAFDKLVDELVDGLADRGFESFGNVRDAVSRSQVKLPDLAGVDELVTGDPLLRADRKLAAALDGAYRQAPAYLLAMQRLSAVAFGVPLGRAITLHLLLPFGGAWILWRGLEHIIEPVTHYALGEPIHIYSRWLVLVTGLAIWILMHMPVIRGAVLEGLRAFEGLLHLVFVVLPRRLLRLPVVERLLKSRPVRLFRRYAWSPLALTGVVWLLVPHDGGWLSRSNPWLPAALFASSGLVLNSPGGRAVQERVLEAVGRALQQIHARLILGLVAWIVDTFRRAVDFIEGMLYAVDEQLRFRADESRLSLAVKSVLTTLWAGVDWVVRFAVTLLIEPQLNPIKHFPVVTVSHKLLVPMIPMVAGNLAAATGMARRLALTTVTFISTAIPGVFGFLAWELKENWRLYAANRPRTLRPVQVGRHGESMRRLLLPGFHSGTIPKLFAKLRRQLRSRGGPGRRSRPEEQLTELGHDIKSFVDDECLGLLRRAKSTADLAIRVADVRLATNLVAIDLAADAVGPDPLEIELCQLGGTLVSSIAATGWLDRLAGDQQRLVRLALAGLDCLCGADFTTVAEHGRVESLPVEPMSWADWQAAWERERGGALESPPV
jgi:hypothetical protein